MPARASRSQVAAPAWVKHPRLIEWVGEVARLTGPDRIHWCDGSQEEYDLLCRQMVASGTLVRLDRLVKQPVMNEGGSDNAAPVPTWLEGEAFLAAQQEIVAPDQLMHVLDTDQACEIRA